MMPASLPSSNSASDPAPVSTPAAPATGPTQPTLLVVDDEEGPRQSLRLVFRDEFKVLLAGDGPSAIALAQQERIDVAVLDVRMAGMSGIEVLERLRFVDPTIEAVMMTGFETPETMRQALRLRACDYLNKPFDVATMQAAVSQALERRTLSSQLRTNASKLEQLQTELQQQQVQEQRTRVRGEIYASILHDISSPLTVISGLLELINDRVGALPRVQGEDLERIKDQLKRITRQVTACIEISRRYLGLLRQLPAQEFRVWTNQALADFGELIRSYACARSNELIIQPLPEDIQVAINGTDLTQILLNLALNALQSTPAYHRVEISGQVLHQALDLSPFRDGPQDRFLNRESFENRAPLLALLIQDNGPGIPPEVLPRLFQPYFTTKAAPQGTGLGLCIVQRLLGQARGALHLHSQPGQGTLFTLYLPACPPGGLSGSAC